MMYVFQEIEKGWPCATLLRLLTKLCFIILPRTIATEFLLEVFLSRCSGAEVLVLEK